MLLAAAMGAGCGKREHQAPPPAALSSTSKAEASEVSMAYLPITADMPLFVALEHKLFEEQGCHVTPVKCRSSNEALQLLAMQKVQGAVMIGFTSIFAVEAKEPGLLAIIQAAGETDRPGKHTCQILVLHDSPLRKLGDLNGRSIGTYKGATQRMNIDMVLHGAAQQGAPVDPEKVQIVQVDKKLQLSAFTAKRFDALFTIDPEATVARVKLKARVLVDNPRVKYILNPFPTCATIIDRRWAAKHAQTVQALMAAMDSAVELLERGKVDIVAIATKYTPVTEDIAAECGTYEWWPLSACRQYMDQIERFADMLYEHGVIGSKVDARELLWEASDKSNE